MALVKWDFDYAHSGIDCRPAHINGASLRRRIVLQFRRLLPGSDASHHDCEAHGAGRGHWGSGRGGNWGDDKP